MKWIPLTMALLLLLSACNRSAPVVTAPSTPTTTTASYYSGTTTATNADTTINRNPPASTTTTTHAPSSTTVAITITTTTASTTGHQITTAHATEDALSPAVVQEIAAIARALGPFETVNELSAERVTKALYVYGAIQTDEFIPYTTETPPIKTICVPIERVNSLITRFFGRTFNLDGLSFWMYSNAIQANYNDKALTFTQFAGYGVDGEFLCIQQEEHDQTVVITLYDAYLLADDYPGVYTEISGKRYEVKGKYLLTVRRHSEELQLVSLTVTE